MSPSSFLLTSISYRDVYLLFWAPETAEIRNFSCKLTLAVVECPPNKSRHQTAGAEILSSSTCESTNQLLFTRVETTLLNRGSSHPVTPQLALHQPTPGTIPNRSYRLRFERLMCCNRNHTTIQQSYRHEKERVLTSQTDSESLPATLIASLIKEKTGTLIIHIHRSSNVLTNASDRTFVILIV
jgi:hypothetical protein